MAKQDTNVFVYDTALSKATSHSLTAMQRQLTSGGDDDELPPEQLTQLQQHITQGTLMINAVDIAQNLLLLHNIGL